MSDVLYDIYSGSYNITPKRDKTQQELEKKLFSEWDKIQQVFGDEFMDRLMELEGEQEYYRAFHYYREGFRLGVRLMLEVLTAPTG